MGLPYLQSQPDHLHSGPGPWDGLEPKLDSPPNEQPTAEPYAPGNEYAVGVNQRSPRHWSGHTLSVDGTQPGQLVPAQKGRKAVLVLVPATATAGAFVDEQSAVLSSSGGPMGFYLAVGASISINTEGAVWAISATAGTDTTVCVIATWS